MTDPLLDNLTDDEYPEPDPGPGERRRAPTPKRVQEVVRSEEDEFSGDITPSNIAKMLRTIHPFYAYFAYIAKTRYPRRNSDRSRVEQMKQDHSRFFWVCIILDILIVLIPLSLLFVAAVAIIGYKTLWM